MAKRILLPPGVSKGNCLLCEREVQWVKQTYKGDEKSTVRNVDDNKAHNLKSGENWICNTNTGFAETAQKVASIIKEPFVPKLITEEQQALWINIVDKATEYTLLAEEEYDKYPQMDNPAKRGMVTKLAYDMMENYQKVKDDD
jgi:hypothetical protein